MKQMENANENKSTYPRCAVRICASIRKDVACMVRQPFHVHWNSGPLCCNTTTKNTHENISPYTNNNNIKATSINIALII